MKKEVTAEEMDIITARLGISAAKFERSDIGKFLLDHTEQMKEDALIARMVADIHDVNANTDALVKYKAAVELLMVLKEVMNSGEAAAKRLDGEIDPDY